MRGGHLNRSDRLLVTTSIVPVLVRRSSSTSSPAGHGGSRQEGRWAESPDRATVGNSAGHLPGAEHGGMPAGYEVGILREAVALRKSRPRPLARETSRRLVLQRQVVPDCPAGSCESMLAS